MEDFSTCPTQQNQLDLAVDWISPTNATSDFFHNCAGRGPCQSCIPNNIFGVQPSFSGNGYAGIFVDWPTFPDYREYIQAELSSPLVPGAQYSFSMAVSLAEYSENAADGIEVHLSERRPLDVSTSDGFFDIEPTFSFDTIIVQKTDWVELSVCFTAKGNERFITIGNFKTRAETRVVPVSGGREENVYYYIDEVVIRPAVTEQLQILPQDTALCSGDSLWIALHNGRSYTWQDGSTNPNRLITEPGVYLVKVEEECYLGIDTLRVERLTEAMPVLPEQIQLCSGEEVFLTIDESVDMILWSDGTMSDSFLIKNEGWVWVQFSDLCGESRDSVYASILPEPQLVLPDDTIMCEGQELIIDLEEMAGTTVVWQDGLVSNVYTISNPGWYVATASNPCGISEDSIFVDRRDLPSLQISLSDSSLCDEQSILVTAETEAGNRLSFGGGSHLESFEITQAGRYIIRATNECGSIEREVEIAVHPCDCAIYYPNSFSPNGDQINDGYRTFSNCKLEDFELMIFSRWGEMVFQTSDQDGSWDGTFQGKAVETGVYTFYSKCRVDQQTNLRAGTITVVR